MRRIRALKAFGSLTKSHADTGQEQLLRNCRATFEGVQAGLNAPNDSLRPAGGAVRVQGSFTWQPGRDQANRSNPANASRRRDGIVMEVDREFVQALLHDDAEDRKIMQELDNDGADEQRLPDTDSPKQAGQDNPTPDALGRIAQENPAGYESSPETPDPQVEYGPPTNPADSRKKAFRPIPIITPMSKAAVPPAGDPAPAWRQKYETLERQQTKDVAKAFLTGAFASVIVLYFFLL